jgi:hypothetical protein
MPSQSNRARKKKGGKGGIQLVNEAVKLSLFADDKIL